MRSRSLNYMPALDGARAIAVAMVFAIHAFPAQTFPGGLGVEVFFVISGFLITRVLLIEYERDSTIKLGRFYLRRLLRLYPALIVMSAATVVFWQTLGTTLSRALEDAVLALTYSSNIYMTVTSSSTDALAHTWSLALEEQFYLIWPPVLLACLIRAVSRRVLCIILGVAIIASCAGWMLTSQEAYFNPLTRSPGLLTGCVTALLVSRQRWQSTPAAWAALAVFAAAFSAETLGLITRALSMPIVALCVPFILLHLAFGQSVVVRALSARWMTYLGVISYGVYLWHYPILWVMRSEAGLTVPVAAAISLALTLVLAAASYRLIETPALRLKDRIGTRAPT